MSGGKSCYPDSDVLINKYNIRDKEILEKFEIQKVFARLLGLDVNPARISYTYDVEHMANYDRKEYLRKIISDALQEGVQKPKYSMSEEQAGEQYKIAKADYEAFREKYLIKKE